jgi:hypothetical protein
MNTTAISVVIRELNIRREAISKALADGTARDYSEYRAMAGEIQGLSLAHSLLTDLVRQMEYDDE